MKDPRIGNIVFGYDRFRFAIPFKGVVVSLSHCNDGVEVELLFSNNPEHPSGSTVWVSRRQLRKYKKEEPK